MSPSKRFISILGLFAVIENAQAACPSNLNGTWVGSGTEIKTASNGLQTTKFSVLVGAVSGNQMTISKVFTADGGGPTATDGPFPTTTFNLDKATCILTTTDGSGISGAVSNGGKTLQVVQGSTGDATTIIFYKQ